jgi:hypothetical protein
MTTTPNRTIAPSPSTDPAPPRELHQEIWLKRQARRAPLRREPVERARLGRKIHALIERSAVNRRISSGTYHLYSWNNAMSDAERSGVAGVSYTEQQKIFAAS